MDGRQGGWDTPFFSSSFAHFTSFQTRVRPNGLRYPLVGGRGQRRFAGPSLKPRKLLENAQTPTSRVHAVLGGIEFPALTDASNSFNINDLMGYSLIDASVTSPVATNKQCLWQWLGTMRLLIGQQRVRM